MIGDPLQEIRERDCSAPAVPDTDPVAAAKSAGLCYVGDGMPGIRRKRNGKAFTYFASDGKALRDPDEIRRIKSLVIPPAWTDVWICPISNGHIQATARDMKGRKQYRYHPRWSYIHPAVLNTYLDGSLLDTIRHRINKEMTESLRELSPEEAAVLAFLQYRMKAEARKKNEKSSSPEKPRNGSLRVLLGQSVRSIRKTGREKLETTR